MTKTNRRIKTIGPGAVYSFNKALEYRKDHRLKAAGRVQIWCEYVGTDAVLKAAYEALTALYPNLGIKTVSVVPEFAPEQRHHALLIRCW